MENDLNQYRVGLGHDIHRLYEDFPLVLGGVLVPSIKGFNTHSDGDVLCHAVIDAMAGAMADGDLGTHFPEDDELTQDALSLDFVREFSEYALSKRFQIVNVDSFVTIGTVRLRPFIAEMQLNIASALQISQSAISVKARSNDGLGLEGEGLAASATAIVMMRQTETNKKQQVSLTAPRNS